MNIAKVYIALVHKGNKTMEDIENLPDENLKAKVKELLNNAE